MAFIKFTETGKSFTPKVSFSNRGLIGFNQGARKRFGIEKYSHCVLYYDPDTNEVAFELTNDETAEGAIKIRLRSIGADVGAKSFLAYFNILPDGTLMCPVEAVEENWIVAKLNLGKERKSNVADDDDTS